MCPRPVTNDRTTPWARSVPTRCRTLTAGNSISKTVTPIAPAPAEEKLTNTPISAPAPMGIKSRSALLTGAPSRIIRPRILSRNKIAVALEARAMLNPMFVSESR